jgi:Flp pilus assembly protein TadG
MSHTRSRRLRARSSVKFAQRLRERGIYATLLAMWMPLFIGALGLGVDISHYWWVRGQLQNAADAAALAGAKELNSTASERVSATSMAATYADQHKVNGQIVTAADIVVNQTGKWQFPNGSFTPTNVSDPSANAIRVTVQRAAVPNFFARVLSGALATETIAASAIGVAGGAGQVPCGFPIVLASCQIPTNSTNAVTCPTNLSFQSGLSSVGLTHPDGSGPVNGNNSAPYIRSALNPATCSLPVNVGQSLRLQNGNDLAQSSVNDIQRRYR